MYSRIEIELYAGVGWWWWKLEAEFGVSIGSVVAAAARPKRNLAAARQHLVVSRWAYSSCGLVELSPQLSKISDNVDTSSTMSTVSLSNTECTDDFNTIKTS